MMTKPDAGTRPPEAEWTDPDDAPLLTHEFFADAEHFKGETFIKRGRGRPRTGNAKEQVSLRLDRDVLAKLREAGPGWQSQVSNLLRVALILRIDAGGPGEAASADLDVAALLDEATELMRQVRASNGEFVPASRSPVKS